MESSLSVFPVRTFVVTLGHFPIQVVPIVRYFLIIICPVVIFFSGQAQDVGFSQFYSNPLYLNPAFTGTLDVPRINLQYRDQWHSLPNAYVTQSISFDMPSRILNGGLGFNLIKDSQASNLLTNYQFSLIYSSIFRLSESLFFSGALQAGYHHYNLDWNRLVFADALDIYGGTTRLTGEIPPSDTRYGFADFATGIVVFGEKMFAGVSVSHLSQPSHHWYDDNSRVARLWRKYTAHVGTRIPVHPYGHWRKSFDLLPQAVFMQQGDYNQLNYGMLADYMGITAGLWFRQDMTLRYDALIFLVGYMKKRWHFTYSYDWTVSGLGGRSGGTSEISLGFLLKDFTRNLSFPFYVPYKDYIGQ